MDEFLYFDQSQTKFALKSRANSKIIELNGYYVLEYDLIFIKTLIYKNSNGNPTVLHNE